jgi:hypothetical protein
MDAKSNPPFARPFPFHPEGSNVQSSRASSALSGVAGLTSHREPSYREASEPCGSERDPWWNDKNHLPYSKGSEDLAVNQALVVDTLINQLRTGELWVVNSRRRNGIIVYREFHAEFAGPGAAVGGLLDIDCKKIIPLGNLSLLRPATPEDLQKALKIRLQWIRLTQNFTDQPRPADRAQMILEQFKTYFDQSTVDQIPDEAFASLVGVLPQTIQRIRVGIS